MISFTKSSKSSLGFVNTCLLAITSHFIYTLIQRSRKYLAPSIPITSGEHQNGSRNNFDNKKRVKDVSGYDVMINSLSKRLISWRKALSEMPRQSNLKRKSEYSSDSESENDDDYDHCARWNTVCSTNDSGDSWNEIHKDYGEHSHQSVPLKVIAAEVVNISSDIINDWEDDFSTSTISCYGICEEDICHISQKVIFEDVPVDLGT